MVTPVTGSPFATAHWIGAAPRYFGSNEPWRFRLPKSRQIEHPLRNNSPIGDHENRIRRDGFELSAKLGVVLDFFRLDNGQLRSHRNLL